MKAKAEPLNPLPIDSHTALCLNTYFEKILVLSLPRLTERRQYVERQLAGLEFEFFMGTDKQEMTASFLEMNYDKVRAKKFQRQGKELNSGEIACSLSHRGMYQLMMEKGWKSLLILEDDIFPLEENLTYLLPALDELPKDWELIYLGYLKNEQVTTALKWKQFYYKIISRLGWMKWNYKMVCHMLPQPYGQHLRKAGFHDCTHAYGITRSAAKKLLEAQTPVVYRADDLLSHSILKGELNAFISDPKFFDQESFHVVELDSEIKDRKRRNKKLQSRR